MLTVPAQSGLQINFYQPPQNVSISVHSVDNKKRTRDGSLKQSISDKATLDSEEDSSDEEDIPAHIQRALDRVDRIEALGLKTVKF